MIPILDLKITQCLAPQGKDNGDFANNAAVDTQGLSGVLFLIEAGSLAAAIGSTAEANALKIEECDTEGGSYTDVTSAALADAIASDEDNGIFAIYVNLKRTHKRYMRVNAPHAGDGSATESFLSIIAIGNPDKGPVDAGGMGLTELITA